MILCTDKVKVWSSMDGWKAHSWGERQALGGEIGLPSSALPNSIDASSKLEVSDEVLGQGIKL